MMNTLFLGPSFHFTTLVGQDTVHSYCLETLDSYWLDTVDSYWLNTIDSYWLDTVDSYCSIL